MSALPEAKFKIGDRVAAVSNPKATGRITRSRLQTNGWVYEVQLETLGRPTYLEAQIVAAPGRAS